jgi:putative FmdB family regulatory protein
MPIYEYECNKCSHKFDLRRKFGEDGGATCPRCGSHAQRIFSPVPIVFKGSGFYVTDSRKKEPVSTDTVGEKPESKAKELAPSAPVSKVEKKTKDKSGPDGTTGKTGIK